MIKLTEALSRLDELDRKMRHDMERSDECDELQSVDHESVALVLDALKDAHGLLGVMATAWGYEHGSEFESARGGCSHRPNCTACMLINNARGVLGLEPLTPAYLAPAQAKA